jgi:outer membrane receptor for Fe3+-dicitrate
MTPKLVLTSCCPDIMGVGLACAASDCFVEGIGGRKGGRIANSLRLIDLIPATFIPAAEAAISAFPCAFYGLLYEVIFCLF